jgi:hypothetical protein
MSRYHEEVKAQEGHVGHRGTKPIALMRLILTRTKTLKTIKDYGVVLS